MAVGFFRHNPLLLFGSLAVLVAGSVLSSAFSKLGQPNIHNMPDILFLALKVPYNFALNYLGICVWTEVTGIGHPIVTWQIPPFLHLADKQIGFNFEWHYPFDTAIALLTVFGSGPVFLAHYARRWRLMLAEFWVIQVIFFYGAISYLLGPAVGNMVSRLVGYGWPVFWIALPYLFYRSGFKPSVGEQILLGACYLLICWWPRPVGELPSENPLPYLSLIVPYSLTIFLLWKTGFAQLAAKNEAETKPPNADTAA
jgi:hypothetical protein